MADAITNALLNLKADSLDRNRLNPRSTRIRCVAVSYCPVSRKFGIAHFATSSVAKAADMIARISARPDLSPRMALEFGAAA